MRYRKRRERIIDVVIFLPSSTSPRRDWFLFWLGLLCSIPIGVAVNLLSDLTFG